jgi:hypothetical protein
MGVADGETRVGSELVHLLVTDQLKDDREKVQPVVAGDRLYLPPRLLQFRRQTHGVHLAVASNYKRLLPIRLRRYVPTPMFLPSKSRLRP